MGAKSSLNEKFKIDGVVFEKPNNKTLRLFFESRINLHLNRIY